jgi:hypothetical protein
MHALPAKCTASFSATHAASKQHRPCGSASRTKCTCAHIHTHAHTHTHTHTNTHTLIHTHLACQLHRQLLRHALAASEQRRPWLSLLQHFPHGSSRPCQKVHICARHAAVMQQTQQLLSHNAHLRVCLNVPNNCRSCMYREACPRLCLACPSIAAGAAAAQSQCTHKCSATVHTQVLSHSAHTSAQPQCTHKCSATVHTQVLSHSAHTSAQPQCTHKCSATVHTQVLSHSAHTSAQPQCTHKCSATVHTQVLSHNAHTSKQEPKTQEGHERRKCLSVFGML